MRTRTKVPALSYLLRYIRFCRDDKTGLDLDDTCVGGTDRRCHAWIIVTEADADRRPAIIGGVSRPGPQHDPRRPGLIPSLASSGWCKFDLATLWWISPRIFSSKLNLEYRPVGWRAPRQSIRRSRFRPVNIRLGKGRARGDGHDFG